MKTEATSRGVKHDACTAWKWCDGHRRVPAGLHQHRIPGGWRSAPGDPQVVVAVEVHDEDDQTPQLVVSLSLDGEIADGVLGMPLDDAEAYALAILSAITAARTTRAGSKIA